MIFNPVRSGGKPKQVKVTIALRGNTEIYYLDIDGKLQSPIKSGKYTFVTLAGHLIATWGSRPSSLTGAKEVAVVYEENCYLHQADA